MGYPITKNRMIDGGDEWVVGGKLTVEAAAEVEVEAGATITGLTGATTFASAAEVKTGTVTTKVIAPDTLLADLVDLGDGDGIVHVSPRGSDVTGDGTFLFPVATVTKAMTLLVSPTRMVISLAPGIYAEAAPVAWPTFKEARLLGPGSQFCSVSAVGASVFTVTPGVQDSTFTGYMQGFEIDHSAGAAQSGITFSNAGMTKKLNFYGHDVPFSADEPTDRSINVATHTDADNAIRIYWTGDGTQKEIGGTIYFNVNNLADRLHCEQLWLVGGSVADEDPPLVAVGAISTSNAAKEMRIRLYKCIVPLHNALSGGSATQVVTAVGCHSWVDYDDITPEIFAALDTGELIGSHSEVIVA